MDASLQFHGSIVLLTPHSAEASLWLDQMVGGDAQWFGRSLAVEPRYVDDLVAGMVEAGLTVGGF